VKKRIGEKGGYWLRKVIHQLNWFLLQKGETGNLRVGVLTQKLRHLCVSGQGITAQRGRGIHRGERRTNLRAVVSVQCQLGVEDRGVVGRNKKEPSPL